MIGGSAGPSPPATLAPDARRVARPSPIGAEGPDVTATPTRLLFFAPTRLASPPEEMESPISDAIMSPEEELDGCEPDPLGKRPAVRPLPLLVGEASNNSPGSDGSLPSTPPPAEEEDDELYRQSLEIISQYLREQATGAKDAKPLGGSGATSRKALETLRRVGDGVQRLLGDWGNLWGDQSVVGRVTSIHSPAAALLWPESLPCLSGPGPSSAHDSASHSRLALLESAFLFPSQKLSESGNQPDPTLHLPYQDQAGSGPNPHFLTAAWAFFFFLPITILKIVNPDG